MTAHWKTELCDKVEPSANFKFEISNFKFIGRPRKSIPAGAGADPWFLIRKEVIQPQVPLRLPCYDFIPITIHTFGAF